MTERFIDVVLDSMKALNDRLQGQITALDCRVNALEARPQLRYCGIHEPGLLYREGSVVTRQGGLWIAENDTQETPGAAASHWRLAVKSGRAPADAPE